MKTSKTKPPRHPYRDDLAEVATMYAQLWASSQSAKNLLKNVIKNPE